MEISISEPVPGYEKEVIEEAMPENKLTLDDLAEDSDYLGPFWTSFMTWTFLYEC